MTPVSHTLYTLALMLALATLNLWKERRQQLAPVDRSGKRSGAKFTVSEVR